MSKSDLKTLIDKMKWNVSATMKDGDFISKEELIKFLSSVEENHPTNE